ncbi:Slit 2 protein [Bulinus truncatus]|nr:Slit 2 protein [Bulinus truncatus]
MRVRGTALLNANKISCVRVDTFKDLTNLNLILAFDAEAYRPPLQEPYRPPLKEPYRPPLKEPYRPPLKEPYRPPLKEPYRPPLKEPYRPPLKEPYRPPLKEPYRLPLKEPYRPPLKEPYRPPLKEPYRPPLKELYRPPLKEPYRLSLKGTKCSLYDNNIQSLANGTFSSLVKIQTIHLARNPLICDCNLKWLAQYLEKSPVETSGVRCLTPRRVRRKKISQLKPDKFKCKGSEQHRTKNAATCMIDRECPAECLCTGTTVDCSKRELTDIPEDMPMYTTELKLGSNKITRIKADGLFKRLPNLQKLDLSDNEIHEIEDGAFENADKLTDLQLSSNDISQLTSKIFQGLNNVNTFNLMSNPFTCNCHLEWLAEWLKKRKIITGTPTCTAPQAVKDTPLKDLLPKDFVCEGK